jgi:hypothetical protein
MTTRPIPLLVLLAAVLVAAGTAGASSRPPTDRSIKLDLIAKLHHGPQILILGDSRGRQAEPPLLNRLTGPTGFNAAVMGGTAPDAWVFIRYTADRFPGQKRRYIWFVSDGLAGNIPDPRTEADPRGRRYLQEVAPSLNTQPLKVDWPAHPFTHYPRRIPPRENLATLRPARARGQVRGRRDRRPDPATPSRGAAVRPKALPALRTRARLHEQPRPAAGDGVQPALPDRVRRPQAIRAAHRDQCSLDYLHGLQARYQLVVGNCENIHTWGGTTSNWKNATHVDGLNMRRMLRYIVAHSDGALH